MTQKQIEKVRELDKKRAYWEKIYDAICRNPCISFANNNSIVSDGGGENDKIIGKVVKMIIERVNHYKEELKKL